MPAVRAGKLRHRVELQAPAESLNTTGEVIEEWRTERQAWVEIKPLSARELTQNEQVEARTTHTMTMRYWSGLTPKHRVLYRDRVFFITGIVDSMERRAVQMVNLIEVWETSS